MMTTRSGERRPPMPIIVGVPRSGTTLLRLMLDAHPALSIPPETWFVRDLVKLPRTGRGVRDRFLEVVTGSEYWLDMGLPADALRRMVEALEPFELSDAVRGLYRLYAQRHGKPRYGDKTPGYGEFMPEIEGLLPEARFIHLIRDGRDVAHSLKGMWFEPGRDVRRLAQGWRRQIRRMRSDAGRLTGYVEVRYEALVTDPAPELQRICKLVELPFDPAMERYFESASDRLAEYEPRFHPDGTLRLSKERRLESVALASKPPQTSRIDRYRDALTAEERRAFEDEAADTLRELGYETEFRSRPLLSHRVRAEIRRAPNARRRLRQLLRRLARRVTPGGR